MEIKSLSQWYTSIDEQSKNVEKFEDTMSELYKKYNKPESELYKPTMCGFYKKMSFTKNIISIFKPMILPIALFAVFFLLFLWSYMLYSLHINPIAAVRVFGLKCLFKSVIIVLCTTIVISLIGLFCKYISISLLKSKLAKLENIIKPILSTIPPEFRTSERMQLIVKVFYTKRDVPPDIALDISGEMMYKNVTRYFEPILYNLEFSNNLISNEKSEELMKNTQSIEENESTNEYLPSDIKSKTFNGSDNSQDDLNKMIGLEDVKNQIEKLKNRIEFYGSAKNNGNHMTFLGGAGTGKTTVARIITKILFDLGIIKKNQYVEISGDYLVSCNSHTISAIIDYSMDGVLFIDEAYLLYDKSGRGNEAIGILLKAMEDHRKDFVCILAGYEEQMTKLLASNEGFTSRIKHTIYFPDYSVDEMYNIFTSFISNYNGHKYTLNEDAKPLLLNTFELEKKSKSFGNARTVRNAADSIIDYYIDRSLKNKTNDNIIQLEDVEHYNKDRQNALQHELKNLSATNQLDESIIRLSELKSKLKNGSEHPDHDLQSLIGLESVNREIELLKSQKDFYDKVEHQNIMLIGPNGCGKSSVAKILTGYLYKLGYIQENKYLDISAEFMKGSYVGHTNKRAEAIISYASGGVLLISNLNAMNDSTDSFASEVLTAITNALHNNNDVTIIIEDTKSDYITSIKDLFTIYYEFPTYSNDQLLQIFVKNANDDNFSTNNDIITAMSNYIKTSNLDINGVISCYNNTKKKHISNYDGNEDTKFILTKDDLDIPKLKGKLKLNIKNNKQTLKLNIKKK